MIEYWTGKQVTHTAAIARLRAERETLARVRSKKPVSGA